MSEIEGPRTIGLTVQYICSWILPLIKSRGGEKRKEKSGGKGDGRGRGEEEKKEAYLLLVQNVYSGPQTVAVVT